MGPGSAVRPGSAFEILADQPLEELRFPYAAAFACLCSERPDENFFAIISDPTLPPRHELTEKLGALQINNMLAPQGWGTVTLPGLTPNSFATVFERPSGARIVNAITETITPFSSGEILRHVLPTLIAALRVFSSMRITHRAIRPTNLFYRGAGAGRQLILGDAVCAPPGAFQPLAYETIEGGMALPHCRGAGTSADDLYALGVTLVFLLMGRDPTVAMDGKELLRAKIERGSFMAITNAVRLPPELVEVLRGLLTDDVRERWTVEDVDHWLQGRRLKPRQHSPSDIVATRPFEFNGRGYYTARGIAHAFASDPGAAARAIRSADFEIWLQRSLADDKRSVAVNMVRAEPSESRGSLAQDLRLTARTCIALDPVAPIRYGDFSTAIDGFGYALLAAFQGRGSLQMVGEMLLARLPQYWMSAQSNLRPEVVALNAAKPFDVLRRFAEDPRLGFGLERVLYELNPRLPCLSPALVDDHVVVADDVLRALEAAAARGALGDPLIDRHVAAFVAARSQQIGRDAFDLLSGTPRQRSLGTLSFLAHLQAAHGPANVPTLGKLISAQAGSLVDMFHSRHRRERIQAEIAKMAAKGTLSDLFWLLQNSSEQGRDAQDFHAAQREYTAIQEALSALKREERERPGYAAELAGNAAVVSATFLAAIIALAAFAQIW
jgi:hypothetical protein